MKLRSSEAGAQMPDSPKDSTPGDVLNPGVISILSPAQGTLISLSEVPDPVFSQEMLGPGLAVNVEPSAMGLVVVASPIAGSLAVIKPHAFVVKSESGFSVLVHIGIDTVTGPSEQFHEITHPGGTKWGIGDQIKAGQFVTTWEMPKQTTAKLVLLTVLDLPNSSKLMRTTDFGEPVGLESPIGWIIQA